MSEQDPEVVLIEKPGEVTAFSIKQGIYRIWKRSLNERKLAYWNHLRFINTAVTYEKWLGKDDPVLPRKFRPLTIPGEADEDKEIRKEMAFKTMESEVRILKNKSKRNKADFIKFDQEMSEVIGRKTTGEVYDSLCGN